MTKFDSRRFIEKLKFRKNPKMIFKDIPNWWKMFANFPNFDFPKSEKLNNVIIIFFELHEKETDHQFL